MSRYPDILSRTIRVLVGYSVYENATVTLVDGKLFLEFEADDLEDRKSVV